MVSSSKAHQPAVRRKPKASTGKEDEELAQEATRILRSHLVRRGLDYKTLANVLGEEGERVLANKVNRGRFTFAFFIRVMRALGEECVNVAPLKVARRAKPLPSGE